MCDDIDLVKTSQNCAVVNIDGNRLRIRILSRSSDSSDLLKIRRELTATTKNTDSACVTAPAIQAGYMKRITPTRYLC